MKFFKDFASHNDYVGLPKPLGNNLDIGFYDGSTIRLRSEPVMIDFYRISIKSNYMDINAPGYDPENPQPITGVFLNSPERPLTWNLQSQFNGIYLHISKKLMEEHPFLFRNYLGYGEHEALYITAHEEKEIRLIFDLMRKHYDKNQDHLDVLLSYAHVLISLIESFYHRQFSADSKKYNRIVSEFQQLLNDYYNQQVRQLPSVQYFADQLHLTPNYLGDIIKHFTNKSAIETIHAFVIKRAKGLLKDRRDLNNSEIAYELGFEYPNYFAKLFKKLTQLTPKEYRNQF
jgi:AraC family transcriptional regulator, transcriptional activator of pobA